MFVTADETLRIFMLKPSTPFSRGFLTPDWHGPMISPASVLRDAGCCEPPAPVRRDRKVQLGWSTDCVTPRRAPLHGCKGRIPPCRPAGPSWPAMGLALGKYRP